MILKDIQFALRAFAHKPGFAAVSVLTLGVGLGMTLTVWGVVDRVVVDALPYPDADRIVELRISEPGREIEGVPMSVFAYQDIVDQARSFQALAVTFNENVNLTGGSSPERVRGARVSAGFFDVMGVPPRLGRGFSPDEDSPGGEPVVVLANGLWQRRYGGDPDIIGKKAMVNGRPHTVVGVAPSGFSFPRDVDVWLPIAIDWTQENRGHGWVVGYGRIEPTATLEAARAELEVISRKQQVEFPETHQGCILIATPIKEIIVGPVRSSLAVLLGAVCCVLLIAAVNVTILLSVRTVARQREVALRQALGASRGRMVRQLVTESTLLALAGGLVGLVFAHWATGAVRLRFAEFIPRSDNLGLGIRAVVVATILSLAVGLAVGCLTALRTREDRIMTRLREAERSVAAGGPLVGTVLVVVEVALAVILLAGAALLIRTFVNVTRVDPGFDSAEVLTAEVSLTTERYGEDADRIDFFRRAVEEIHSLPQVEAAGTVYPLPLFGRRVTTDFRVEGMPNRGPRASESLVELRFVSPGYLESIGLRQVSGRFIEESDTADSPSVVVVNESFVRQLAPVGDPVGRRVTGDDPSSPDAEWSTIVGVVEGVRHIDLTESGGPEAYIPVTQFAFEWATFVVRAASGTAEELSQAVIDAIHRVDPDLPVFNVQTLDSVLSRSLNATTFVTSLLSLFAATGLALAGVGVFSVVSYSVSRRLREVAIRMALGSSPGDVLSLVMRQGLVPASTGVMLGLLVSLAAMRILSSRLYGVAVHDPVIYGVVAVLILVVAAVATWTPARRATRVEPMTLLRTE